MNWFAVTICVLDFLAGSYYVHRGELWMGLLWIVYGIGNVILLKIAGF
jgi:hypothetical protein